MRPSQLLPAWQPGPELRQLLPARQEAARHKGKLLDSELAAAQLQQKAA